MSESLETTLNESPFALAPRTKRDTFHWPKYSFIVGTMTTTAVKASDARRLPRLGSPRELARVEREGIGGGLEHARVRQHLAELALAVAVEVGPGHRGRRTRGGFPRACPR